MNPLRILILCILFYILFRLLFGRKKVSKDTAKKTGQGGQLSSQDILVEDPVCHTYIPKKQAIFWEKNDKTIYFCSEKCRESFLKKGDKE